MNKNLILTTISRIGRMIVSPRKTSLELMRETGVSSSLSFVLGYSTLLALMFLISYLSQDYPPHPEVLQVWIEAWGEFAMLPFVKIPAESYRLWLAISMVPIGLAIWMLMAGTAKLLSMGFHGKASYLQYLNLLGFSFFPFWMISAALDLLYSGFLGAYIVPALNMEYGLGIRDFFHYFPTLMYPLILALGGAYNAIAIHVAERFSFWKSAILGAATFFWPIVLISALMR